MKKKTVEEIKEYCCEFDPDIILFDEFSDAFIGVVRQSHAHIAMYDLQLCVDILEKRDGMSQEDAREYLEFNTLGSHLGNLTPIFYDHDCMLEVEVVESRWKVIESIKEENITTITRAMKIGKGCMVRVTVYEYKIMLSDMMSYSNDVTIVSNGNTHILQ